MKLGKFLASVLILALMLSGLPMQSAQAAGTISLTTLGETYTQDFDTLASTGTSSLVPTGWDFSEAGTNANTTYTAGTGSSNTGDTYSFGASGSSERAFGGLQSGSLVPIVGASFTNNTGETITELDISYTGEQWRLGALAREDRIDFQLSMNATSLTTGTWTDYNELDFIAPTTGPTVGFLDGNALANRTAINFTITGLDIPDGATFWIRWMDFNASGADDGLSVDDFLLIPQSGPVESSDPKINEFVFNHVGTDTNEYVEIVGDPNTDYSAYAILQLEGDGIGAGVIDSIHTIGTTNASGHWYTGFLNNVFENGTVTLLLVKDFTGAVGNDLDTNNDGVFDSTPWSALVDDVAVSDGGAGDVTYSSTVLAPGFSGSPFTPGGASRFPDGASDWVLNDFDGAGLPGFLGSPVVGEAYNTPGAANELVVPPPEVCGDPFTPIYAVQGSGLVSPLVGSEVAVEGIVVGDFQNNAQPDNGDLNGFHIQDPVGDGDPSTSDGIFVFAPGAIDVSVGDKVRVRGIVDEFFNRTEINGVSVLLQCSIGNELPTEAEVSLPVTSLNDFEKYEGMAVTIPEMLYISEYFNFDRFGEIVLTTDRQFQPTAVYEPGSPEAAALALANSLSRITLDDGRSSQNPDPAIHPNGMEFTLENRFRGGDTVQNVTGVMDYSFGLYRIQPTEGADYSSENPRTDEPEDVGGRLTVASFNVLNYFLTIDTGPDICGPLQNQECRGADTAEEFDRQRAKILSALSAIEADVFGLIEMENTTGVEPLADIVAGLNAELGAGTYAYIDTGTIGTDAIKVGIIYKPATVTPLGDYAILDSSVDPRFDDDRNRPVLAQSFQENATGMAFTVAVNHLKSKGSPCGAGDDDPVQGNCNLTRTLAAEALVDWLASDPTGSGDEDFLITGDLNAYDKEDPIDAVLEGADDALGTGDDYTDLLYQFIGEFAYSYVFDGQLGYLDHALANAALLGEVTGATVWHINADEPDIIDYDTSFKKDPQDALYEPNPYRSSDHDPVIVGLDLTYDFTGFFPPIENLPTFNVAKAGSSIPVNFSLNGDFGLDIFAPGYPKSEMITCGSTDLVDGTEETETAGSSGLSYDPVTDTYTYVWKTDKAWKNTCRQLVVKLDDDTFHRANFSFK